MGMKFRGKADTDKNIAGRYNIQALRSRPKSSPASLNNNNKYLLSKDVEVFPVTELVDSVDKD